MPPIVRERAVSPAVSRGDGYISSSRTTKYLYSMETSTLPQRDDDAVLTLYAHYFLAGELMLENYKKLTRKLSQRGRQSQADRANLSIYFCTWLGFLAVTAEGFKKLAIRKLIQHARPPDFLELLPRANELGSLLKRHEDALRKFRNNVFHLRENSTEVERFFYERPSRLEWGEELQSAFGQFFSNYRILCQVQYLIEKRTDELSK